MRTAPKSNRGRHWTTALACGALLFAGTVLSGCTIGVRPRLPILRGHRSIGLPVAHVVVRPAARRVVVRPAVRTVVVRPVARRVVVRRMVLR